MAAVGLVKVTYAEERPDLDIATAPKAPSDATHPVGNSRRHSQRGDTARGLADAAVKIEHTYTTPFETDTLTGRTPPDEARSTSVREPPSTANDDTSLLPALATTRIFALSESATANCDASGSAAPPMPVPPVANVPAGTSDPSAARANATTALPLIPLVETNTPPTVAMPARERVQLVPRWAPGVDCHRTRQSPQRPRRRG